jgi:Domain of unknown function (DUF4270)
LQKRFLPTAFLAATLLVIGYSCTKFDTTTQGADLVTVDNINTFQKELEVFAIQGIFNNTNDSTILKKTENHVVGNITNDPSFGKTDARIYVQFKPTFYPFYFGNAGDTTTGFSNTGFDSAFICLSYRGAWGDTSAGALPQKFEVRAVVDNDFRDKTDTLRRLTYQPSGIGALLGSVNLSVQDIVAKKRFRYSKDSIENQIRIPLTGIGATYAASIFTQDSTTSGLNNAFKNDSIFRSKFNGFEIKVTGAGSALYYVNLGDAKTRLEFQYFKRTATTGFKDTVTQSFQMFTQATGSSLASSSANYVKREYTGASIPPVNSATPDVFIQTAPGTFANLSIPSLDIFNDTNRIIHRAYLVVEQNPFGTPSDAYFTPPPYLYLDLKDTSLAIPQRYKPVPLDLSNQYPYNPDATGISPLYHPFPYGNVDLNNFGGVALKRYDATGGLFYRYEINITRYVQNIVTNGYKNYDLRLYAPFNYFYPQYEGAKYVIPFYNPLALGRVRVGTNTNTNNHKMKLVIVYSKI